MAVKACILCTARQRYQADTLTHRRHNIGSNNIGSHYKNYYS